jgi:hypothetical protein
MAQHVAEPEPADRVAALVAAYASAAATSASPWTRRGRRRFLSLVTPVTPLTRRLRS